MFSNIFGNLNWSVLTDILTSVIPALICITLHELAHGLTAYALGDRTAKEMGRLTLNPIKHIDAFGLLMMVVFKFGWAKPVPVNMYNFKKPKWGMAITAIAGPLLNVVLAAVVMFFYGLFLGSVVGMEPGGVIEFVDKIFYITAYLSVALAIFNLIPIPPLDGSKVLFSLLPERAYDKLMRYERYGMILLIIFINIDAFLNTTIFSGTVGRLTESLFGTLFNVAIASYRLVVGG